MSKRILLVDKTGVIKESMIKSFNTTDLYKKAGFKTAEGFELAHQWSLSDGTIISLYGKTTGKAGQENKYDFPPPVDNVLFFGSCVLVSDKTVLKKTEWEAYYEELFGGFEDIGEEDSEISEDDESDGLPRTKAGYVKDGFIVDDEDEDDGEDEEEDVDEDPEASEEEVVVVTKKQPKRADSRRKAKPTVFDKIETSGDDNFFLDCTSELQEEEYE